MSNLKVNKGDALTAQLWNRVVDRLGGEAAGFPAVLGHMPRVTVRVKNNTGSNLEIGHLMRLSSYTGPLTAALDVPGSEAFEGSAFTWHTAIAQPCVTAEPIPDGEYGVAVVSGLALIKTANYGSGYDYVMIDPAAMSQGKVSTGGFARVLAQITISSIYYALAVVGDGSNLWRYELTQNSQQPNVTTAKLLDLDGNELNTGTSINLTDPDGLMSDQVTGDKGWCIHAGNKFYAQQAVCS